MGIQQSCDLQIITLSKHTTKHNKGHKTNTHYYFYNNQKRYQRIDNQIPSKWYLSKKLKQLKMNTNQNLI